ncbi:DUF5753 domain-containing protein [Micromonospora matsumotoense]|uniref:DUF5753 domain-containing protein n=1 Tax=Micromonospora matsumotoense TaxID=121616 RepID=UPI003D9249DD
MQELRAGAARRGWWHEYSQLFPAEFLRFLGYEAGADHIRSFHPEAIHGLLQTEAYARAVIRGGTTTIRLTEVDRRVSVRMARQARLDGAHPLRISAVLSEGALRQQVGGPAVMRAQLDHLVRLATERPEQIEMENLTSVDIIDQSVRVTDYVVTFAETRELALGSDDSVELIRRIAKEMM